MIQQNVLYSSHLQRTVSDQVAVEAFDWEATASVNPVFTGNWLASCPLLTQHPIAAVSQIGDEVMSGVDFLKKAAVSCIDEKGAFPHQTRKQT